MESLEKSIAENIPGLTLSEVVTNNFKAAAIFEKYGLDFCCGGKKSISKACEEKGIDQNEILIELENLNESNLEEKQSQFNQWELDFLTDYIINIHHKYVREAIPVISATLQK